MKRAVILVSCLTLFAPLAARADEPRPITLSPGLVPTPPPKPDPEPPVVWSVIGGTAAAMIPLAIGGGLMARSDTNQDRQRRTGLDLIVTGFALAPIVSHLAAREWKRAAIFGACSLVLAGVAIGTVEWRDGEVNLASIQAKNIYGAAVTATVVVSAAGIIDSLLAGSRWRDRQKKRAQRNVTALAAPTFGPQQGGVVVGGTW